MEPSTVESSISTNSPRSSDLPFITSSPVEDISGLDVFAQIAASANPLPVVPVRRASIATTSAVHQSQSQLVQNIYQAQQALRLQQQQQAQTQQYQQQQHKQSQQEDSKGGVDNLSDFDDDDDFDFDDDESDDSSSSTTTPNLTTNSKNNNNNNMMSNISINQMSIKEESESDLMMDMDVDPPQEPLSFSPRLNTDFVSTAGLHGRRSSAPPGQSMNTPPGVSNRRVVHNICERKRRENIRDGFAQLQARLPPFQAQNTKISKMEILQGAKNVIKDIKDRISALSDEVIALRSVADQVDKVN